MALTVRRLAAGDEAILITLAEDAADFDVAGRSSAEKPLSTEAAQRYLQNPAVLHWVAIDGDQIVGTLLCHLLPMSAEQEHELLLYEIGVRSAWRRRGVGRLLLAEMETWMRNNDVAEVWVLADNLEATEFYRACGFTVEDEQPVYLTQRIED